MNTSSAIAVAGLGFGAWYLFVYQGGPLNVTSAPLGPVPAPGGGYYPPGYTPPEAAGNLADPAALYAGYTAGYGRTAPGNAPQIPAMPNRAPSPVTGMLTGGAATGIAGATGLIGAAAVATAGIGIGVGLLAWGIMDKGWFRGGEEGAKVNPARDAFLSQFAGYDYMRDKSNPPGFYGLSNVLTILGHHDFFDALAHADTMDEFTAAATDIQNALARGTPAQLAAAKAASRY